MYSEYTPSQTLNNSLINPAQLLLNGTTTEVQNWSENFLTGFTSLFCDRSVISIENSIDNPEMTENGQLLQDLNSNFNFGLTTSAPWPDLAVFILFLTKPTSKRHLKHPLRSTSTTRRLTRPEFTKLKSGGARRSRRLLVGRRSGRSIVTHGARANELEAPGRNRRNAVQSRAQPQRVPRLSRN